ncbi:MAG: LodA/GoxA family CTQ-dependent oxidase, partial [Tumebacillaceae bacterium]
SDQYAELRKQVLDRFLSPNHARPKQSQDEAIVQHAVTRTQYLMLERWAEGHFVADWKGAQNVSRLEELPIEMQPAALDTAPLMACSGGELFAGMNSVWPLRQKETYAQSFRIRADKHQPGDLTRGASLPWQAEFYANSGTVTEGDWWPSLRPQQVVTEGETRQQWDRGIDHDNDMATAWSRLGIVTRQEAADGSVTFTETERSEIDPRKFEGLSERDFYHILNNMDLYYEYLPTVKRLAQRYFAECEELMNSPHFEPNYRHFPFSKEVFDQHLDRIYEESVGFYAMLDIKDVAKNIPVESVYERIRQLAPTNMMDGAWLQNITKAGPADRIKSALFAIFSDELGNGKIEENHSNVFCNLLESIGMYMPDTRSRSFVDQKELFDSSFTNPVFQLSVSMFPRDFFPELIGMTLFLEWEATPAFSPIVQMLKYYGMDPHFFSLHVAIDNVDSGHGAMSKQIVEWYLEDIRSKGGDEAVQEQWRRIWRGYVCFATTGRHYPDQIYSTFDVSPAACKERMMDLILKKAKYGAPQHKDAKNMPNIGKMFDDPERMLDMLNKAGYFIPGDPENSRFMKLMNFDGPMFRVFTDQELKVIRDYIYSLNREEEATKPIDLGAAMKALVVKKADMFDMVFASIDEWTNTKTVQELSDDPIGTMRDLVHSKLAIPYNVRQSRLAFLVSDSGFLFFSFTDEERTIIQSWVAVGCPIPGASGRHALLNGPYVTHVKVN